MNKKEKIEQQINKTLDQFDHAEQLAPNPYFYTRVQARLEEQNQQRNVFTTILKPAFLTTLVAINIATAFWHISGNDQNYQTNSQQELTEILAGDLNLDQGQTDLFAIE